MSLRSRLTPSERRQRQATAAMELLLVGILAYGFLTRNVGIIVNAGIGIAVTQLVPVLERDLRIQMEPILVLWITSAVFLHALGTVSVSVTDQGLLRTTIPLLGTVEELAGDDRMISLYSSFPGWDHLTHAVSASVVAAAGYVTARAYDLHDDRIYLPPRFMFVFILLVTLAFGVFWEVIEFTLGVVGGASGLDILTQYGLRDTMLDLVFDSIGAVIVATWGTARLSGVVTGIRRRLSSS